MADIIRQIIADLFAHDMSWKTVLSAFGLILTYLFGAETLQLFYALNILIIIDWIFGFSSAWLSGEEITTRKFFKTPAKIGVFSLIIIASHLTDTIITVGSILETTTLVYLAGHEFISILRNAGKLGYKTPKKLLNVTLESIDA